MSVVLAIVREGDDVWRRCNVIRSIEDGSGSLDVADEDGRTYTVPYHHWKFPPDVVTQMFNPLRVHDGKNKMTYRICKESELKGTGIQVHAPPARCLCLFLSGTLPPPLCCFPHHLVSRRW